MVDIIYNSCWYIDICSIWWLVILFLTDWRRRRWPQERDATPWNLCSGNSNVHCTEKQQKTQGNNSEENV